MLHERQLILFDLSEDRYPHLSEWAEYLSDCGFDVHLATWGTDEDCVPDIVIVGERINNQLEFRLAEAIQSGLVATVSVESADHAEFHISHGVSRDIFFQFIEMVAQIVRLRRRLNVDQLRIQSLSSLALTDPLTGIANRRAWTEELISRINDREPICIAIIDADYFKSVNDEDGHNVGDKVLRAIAQTMRSKLRGRDFLARLGGDEFGLIISDVDYAVADSIVERIRTGVTSSLQRLGLPNVTLSAGYVFVQKHTHRVSDELLYAMASKALRVAKRKQRNCTYGHLV